MVADFDRKNHDWISIVHLTPCKINSYTGNCDIMFGNMYSIRWNKTLVYVIV